jgi:hypothetical protein
MGKELRMLDDIMNKFGEPAEVLAKARAKLVEDRRIYAGKLAGKGESEELERWRPIFVQIQETIEAVDRALLDERKLAERGARPVDQAAEIPQAANATPFY